MLRQADEMQDGERPDIRQVLEQLVADGRGWAEAELALARIEIGELRNQAIRFAVFAALAFAAVFSALVMLAQSAAAFLLPHVGDAGIASLIVAVLLLLIAGLFALAMKRALGWRTESIFFRWLGRSRGGTAP